MPITNKSTHKISCISIREQLGGEGERNKNHTKEMK